MAKRILFIDDEPEFVRAHVNALEEVGKYDVVFVKSYEEAFEALQNQRFDLIILDLILPPPEAGFAGDQSEPSVEVGFNLRKVIREEMGLTQVPIIFFTVVNEIEPRRQIHSMEVKLGQQPIILVKPKLPSRLLAAVSQALGVEHD